MINYFRSIADRFLEETGHTLKDEPRVIVDPVTKERFGVGVQAPEGWQKGDDTSDLYSYSFKQTAKGKVIEFNVATGTARPAWLLRDHESKLLEFNGINAKAAVPAFTMKEIDYLDELFSDYYRSYDGR